MFELSAKLERMVKMVQIKGLKSLIGYNYTAERSAQIKKKPAVF